MKNREAIYNIRPDVESKEHENISEIPIIDIIRHGSTDYKELKDSGYILEPGNPDFKLDTQHLDLNEQGIQEIKETANQFEKIIDKDKEAIILVTSPNFRARSSVLLLEDELRKKGVTIVNPGERIHETKSLRQISFQDENFRSQWIEKDSEFREADPNNKKRAPDEAHVNISKMLGKDLTEIFTEDYEDIDLRFKRFLRHMTNLDRWLSEETKLALQGKQKRIICLTHEELPIKFMKETLGTKENLKKGQILEMKPSGFLEEDDEIDAKLTLYPKGDDSESGEVSIKMEFSPN
jgi:broad specificity phosphatase PhoE